MPRSTRVVIQSEDDDGLEEKRPEPPAAAAAALITGLEDPATSEDALRTVEASRRTHDERRQGDASVRGRRSSFFVFEETTSTLDDFLAQPHVMRELRKTERALADVENGAGSIEDVNMFFAVLAVDLDLMHRFGEVGGRCISSITAGHACARLLRARARCLSTSTAARTLTAFLALRLFRMHPRCLAHR